MGNYGMKREIHIKGNGKIIKQKDGVYIIQKKEYFLGENGLPTNKTVSGSKDGREEVFFLGSIIMEIKMVLFQELAVFFLRMEEDIKECGKIIKWMGMDI